MLFAEREKNTHCKTNVFHMLRNQKNKEIIKLIYNNLMILINRWFKTILVQSLKY